MANVLILGGHGKVALQAAPLLVQAGHEVTSAVRNPDHRTDVEATGASVALVDLQKQSTEDFEKLFESFDVIVWSAGVGGGDPERTFAVDRDAAIRTMDAAGDKRYIMVSYFGAGQDHGVPEDHDFYSYAQSKADADDHLKRSAARWTILGPSRLTSDDAHGGIEVNPAEGDSVARADVARVVAAVVDADNTIGKTIEFNTGETPIEEAIAAVV